MLPGHRFGARLTEGSAGDQVALQVELIVNGIIDGQKPLFLYLSLVLQQEVDNKT